MCGWPQQGSPRQGSPNAFFQFLVTHELPRPGRGGRVSPSGRGKWWAPCTRCIRGGCVAPRALAPPTVLDLTPRRHVFHAWVLFVGHWLSAFGVPVLSTLLLTLLVPWLNLRPIWLQLKPHCRPGAAACLGLHYPSGKVQPMCSNAPPTTLQTTAPLSCWISVRLRREPSILCACSRCGRSLHVSPNEPGHSGTTGSQSVAQLQALLADAHITMIVLSHADKDHYALLPQVFDLSAGVPEPLQTLKRVVLGGKRNCYTGAIDAWLLALSAGGVTVATINHEQPCWAPDCGVLSPCPNPGVTATVLAANQVCSVCRYCRTTTLD